MEYYGRMRGTEEELDEAYEDMSYYNQAHRIISYYFRKLKDGTPGWREFKVSGSEYNIKQLKEDFSKLINDDWSETKEEQELREENELKVKRIGLLKEHYQRAREILNV